MNTVYHLGLGTIVFIIAVIVFTKVRGIRRRKVLEPLLERYLPSREALVRYVMLNRQCSEDAAVERLALFVARYGSSAGYSSIDRMLVDDRQRLLESVYSILAHDPNAIDKI